MAKKRKRSGNSAYFRNLFTENPGWLHITSNDDVVARYRADHNLGANAEVSKQVRQAMANVKSIMRKGTKGRKSKAASGAVAVATGRPRLDTLEDMIDDCMVMAEGIDRDGLEYVLKLLRHARNEVVWKMGQKA